MLLKSRRVSVGDNVTQVRTCLKTTQVVGKPDAVITAYIQGGNGYIVATYLDSGVGNAEQLVKINNVRYIDVCYDGEWLLDSDGSYKFICVDKISYVYVDNNYNLYFSYNEKPPVLIDTQVTCASMVRGWRNLTDAEQDQGLAIAYIKTDSVKMIRYYASELKFSNIQTVKEITADSVNLSRTHDYRLCISIQVGKAVELHLTERCWTGQAGAVEHLKSNVSNVSVITSAIDYIYDKSTEEHLNQLAINIKEAVGKWSGATSIMSVTNEGSLITIQLYGSAIPTSEYSYECVDVVDSLGIKYGNTFASHTPNTWVIEGICFNNAYEEVTITLKGVGYRNAAGVQGTDISFKFTPVGLTPDEIDPPVVLAIYNEEV